MFLLIYVTLFLSYSNVSCANNYHWSIFRSTIYSGLIKCDHRKDLNLSVNEMKLYFYDFQNNVNFSFPIDSALKGITSSSNLDTSRQFVFFVPGYKSHIDKDTVEIVRQSFKNVSNIYLIILDHYAYTAVKDGTMKSYSRSVSYTYYIGNALGKFIAGLNRYGIPSKNMRCIGHSLGSQILGHAGTTYYNETSEKLARITGIDPAGPCFSNALIDEQIRSGIADYVEVYHCNAGGLGTSAVLADADFFFNKKGKKQPECGGGIKSIVPGYGEYSTSKCSHRACLRYWALSVRHPNWYLAWKCDSYDDYKNGKCAGNQQTLAGYWSPGNATGVFYVSTELYGVI